MTKNKQKQEAFIDTSLHSLLLVSSSKTFWHFVPYIVLKPGCFPELKYVSHVIASGKWRGRNLLWKICIVPVEQEHRTQSCSRCLKLMSISLCHIFIQQPNQCVTITVMKWHLASEILDITWLKHLFVWVFFGHNSTTVTLSGYSLSTTHTVPWGTKMHWVLDPCLVCICLNFSTRILLSL